MQNRKLVIVQTPSPHGGFLGPGHVARAVVKDNFLETDPFIVLMDDMLDVPDGEPVGGPHPHAGFETVTLVLEGKLSDSSEGLSAGDFQMMTAGKGPGPSGIDASSVRLTSPALANSISVVRPAKAGPARRRKMSMVITVWR